MSRDEEQDLAERIRLRAYRLWEQDGRPEGREGVHWDQASELVAIEDNYRLTTQPVSSSDNLGPSGEPIESSKIMENLGEFPTLTDQGEEQTFPDRQPEAQMAAPTSKKAVEAGRKKTPAGKSAHNGIQGTGSKRGKETGARTTR